MNGRRTVGSQIEMLFLKAGKRLSLDKDDLISISQNTKLIFVRSMIKSVLDGFDQPSLKLKTWN